MFFVVEDTMMGTKEYLLSESIKPLPTNKYGTNKNLNNQQWMRYDGCNITFTEIDGLYYMVGISRHDEAMFQTSTELDFDRIRDPKYLDEVFTTERMRTKKILIVFNIMIYLLIQCALKFKHEDVVFMAADPSLGTVYSMIMRNKWFIEYMEDSGFRYNGFNGEEWIFTKL